MKQPKLRDYDSIERKDLDTRNGTTLFPLQPPFSLHSERQMGSLPLSRKMPRAILSLFERAFQCPTGTSSCDSISRPDSCCPSGEVCQLINDSGDGDVGCCRQGQSCSDEVAGCTQGYTSCPGSQGGGCCIPGYVCIGVGCEFTAVASTARAS